MPMMNSLSLESLCVISLGILLLISGCAFVPQRKREYLSNPIMQRQDDPLESILEGHDMPRREGSVGGSSGSGGGCGC
jgi:hypothetical protein